MITIIQKELADYFTSVRFIILLALAILISAYGLYSAQTGIRSLDLPSGFVFMGLFTTPGMIFDWSMVTLLAIVVIPLIGILLGFDAINSERTSGTLSRLIAQPIYRDNVINAKFIAGISAIVIIMGTIILIVAGYGLRMIGVAPTAEEISRLVFYFIFAVIYGGFWLALAMLFSLAFRNTAGSILTTIGLWLFFAIFIMFLVPLIANNIVPITSTSTFGEVARNYELQETISRFSPAGLFTEASMILVAPSYGANIFTIVSSVGNYYLANPLSLSQSLLLIWPQLTSLIALTAAVFGINYVVFMRQEIRST